MFGIDSGKMLSDLVERVKEEVPGAIHRQATQMNLADTVLAEVIRQAVKATVGQLLPEAGLGRQAASLLSGVSSLLGNAESLGVGQLIQRALDSTDLDEQLRDALIDGFARYLRENAAQLAKVALHALSTAGAGSGER